MKGVKDGLAGNDDQWNVLSQEWVVLKVLDDLKTVLMFKCLHLLWISSERPLI